MPFHVQRIITFKSDDPTVSRALYVVSGIFYFLSAAINPFMYKRYLNMHLVFLKYLPTYISGFRGRRFFVYCRQSMYVLI